MAMEMNEASMNLLAQYLSAAGQDIGSGKPIGTNVNTVTQQQVAARSYANLLRQLLGGGGKITADAQNVNIKAPIGAFGSMTEPVTGEKLGPQNRGTIAEPVTGNRLSAPTSAPTSALKTSSLMSSLLLGGTNENPSPSPLGNLSGADLAGLTPRDISQALGIKMAQDEVDRRFQADAIKNQIDQRRLGIEEAKLLKDEKTTAAIKEYEYAQAQGYKGSFEEFKNSTASAGIKDYEYAVRQGYEGSYYQWKTELAEKSRSQVNIIDRKVEEKKALAKLEGQLYFSNPKWTEDLGKVMSSEDVQNKLFALLPEQRKEVEPRIKIKFIEDKITAGGGQIVGFNWVDDEKKVIEWRVRWPSGDVETVRYGIRD